MAKGVFDATATYKCRLFGHAFTAFPCQNAPQLTGTLAADTVEVDNPVFGKSEYAVFTVNEPTDGDFSPAWVGTYRLPMSVIDSWFGGKVEE